MPGFNGRVFLHDYEHETYLRRMPVRYVRHPKAAICAVCGLPDLPANPLENSHLVPFGEGVRTYKLTPDWLDSPQNIVTAHKRSCNKAAELSKSEIEQLTSSLLSQPASAD